MGCKYVCDGCGKEEPAIAMSHGFFKPQNWYQRSDGDGPQVACSRACIDKTAKQSGKTGVIAPGL